MAALAAAARRPERPAHRYKLPLAFSRVSDQPPAEEQRFAFEVPPSDDADHEAVTAAEEARALVARVEAVHAVATRRAVRRARSSDEDWIESLFVPETSPAEPAQLADEPSAAEAPAEEEGVAGEPGEESLTVAQFYRRVRRALEGAFPEEVWVTGEIRGIREARGGHRYIELADHGAESSGRAVQQLEVTCWARDWPPVAASLAAAGVDLEVGRVIRVRGRVSIWEGGGKLRFSLTLLDIEALLGSIAAARRQLLQALAAEGLLEANRCLPVPLVPLRIGLVTSPGSEAHRDFVGQLARSGFAFELRLEPSLVQGAEAPQQLAAALKRLRVYAPDLAVIVRGGGARGDLAAFDSEELARAIATAPFPVWAGVGHTGDRSVADEVANFSTITPTACGEAVVARVALYYEEMRRRVGLLASLARGRLDSAHGRLSVRAGALVSSTHRQLDHRVHGLDTARAALARNAARRLQLEEALLRQRSGHLSSGATRRLASDVGGLERLRQVLVAYDPARQFQRGWSLTHLASGRLLRSAAEVTPGAELVTRLGDGTVASVVKASAAREDEGDG